MSLPTAPAATRVSCSIIGCRKTFIRLHDMRRHVRNTHFGEKLGCPVFPGQECGFRGAIREDIVRRHVKEKHPEYYSFDIYVPRGFGHQNRQLQHQNGNTSSPAFVGGTRFSTVETPANNFSQSIYAPRVALPVTGWNEAPHDPTTSLDLSYLQGNVARGNE